MSANLDALRSEYEQLSTRMNRVAILTLTIVLLLVLGLTNAIQEVRESKDYLKLLELQRRESAGDVDDAFIARSDDSGYSTGETAKLREQVVAAAKAAYTHEVGMLGMSINVDLRQALIVLPAILLGSAIYMLVVWFKREAVQRLGEHALASTDAPKDVNGLYFGGVDTPYAEYPGRLGWWGFVVAMAALLYVLLTVTRPIWSSWELELAFTYTAVSALIAGCALLYACSIGAAIGDQAASRIGAPIRGGLAARLMVRAAALRAWLATIRRCRVLGLSAGSLVLLSLVAPVGQKCVGRKIVPAAGWELVRHPVDSIWLTSLTWFWDRQILGMTAYGVSLLLAAVTIVSFAIWLRRSLPRRLAVVMASIAAVAGAYGIADTGFFFPLLALDGEHIYRIFGNPGLIVQEALVVLFVLASIAAAILQRRPKFQAVLWRAAVAFIPIAFSALAVTVAMAFSNLYGYTMWAAGLLGLALAWWCALTPLPAPAHPTADLADTPTDSGGSPTRSSSLAP